MTQKETNQVSNGIEEATGALVVMAIMLLLGVTALVNWLDGKITV